MYIELSEQQLIHILNCISYTKRKMIYHNNSEDKRELEFYYDFENYNENLYDLVCLNFLLALKGNIEYYNTKNDIFFIGQKNYLIKGKNFNFLKNDKKIKSNL